MNNKKMIAFASIAALGNLLIMISEKQFLNLQEAINNKADMLTDFTITNGIIITKVAIWVSTMFLLAFVCNVVKAKLNTNTNTIIMLFFATCFEINLNIVDHPLWLKIAIIPLTIAPFLLVGITWRIITKSKMAKSIKSHLEKEEYYYDLNF